MNGCRSATRILAAQTVGYAPHPASAFRPVPTTQFSLLIGSDNAACFNQWIAYQEILERYPVLVYPREGHPAQPGPTTDKCTFLQDVPLLPQAATDIRGLIADNGKDTKALVERELPAGVWEYIKMHKLYGCR